MIFCQISALKSNLGSPNYGTWKDLPAGFNTGRVYGLQGIPATNIPLAITTVFTFTADVAGLYLFEIRWWGKLKQTGLKMPFMIFNLYKGSSSTAVDTFEQ
jgi:hypothetical protein